MLVIIIIIIILERLFLVYSTVLKSQLKKGLNY